MAIIGEHETAFFERPFRTQAPNEPRWARAALVEHVVAPQHARAAPVEHSALPRWLEGVEHFAVPEQIRAAPVEHSAAPGHARASISSQLRRWARLERPFRASCSSAPGSSGHFEAPFPASCGSGPGSSGHFEPAAAPGQARAAISSHVRLWALEVGNVGRCGVFEPGRPCSREAP